MRAECQKRDLRRTRIALWALLLADKQGPV